MKNIAALKISCFIYIKAASPLSYSGFSAIGCFKASPYGGICLKPSPDQDWTNKKRIFQIGPSVPKEIGLKQTHIDRS